jgi:phosphate starvation-inducible PhoH-like protein
MGLSVASQGGRQRVALRKGGDVATARVRSVKAKRETTSPPLIDPRQFFDDSAAAHRSAAFLFSAHAQEGTMAKRPTKRAQRITAREANAMAREEHASGRRLHVVQGGFDPANDSTPRDQSYVKTVKAKSKGQQRLLDAIDKDTLVLALGPAGTGKTYLAIAKAVEALETGKVGRIVLSRPAVEAGESLGFLPGAMEDKLAPYLRPLYDALQDRLSAKRLKTLMAEGLIEIAPVGFMRGRTLNNAFVVIDEAQNCTFSQIKMLLTRLGWHSTMVVTGDPAQTDLLPELSGLAEAARRLEELGDVAVVRLADADIVRHPLVARMLTVL